MIDQATKVLNAVHKRMHAAQAQEFQLLTRCFQENPESFWQRNKKPAYPWDEATFLAALDDCQLVPPQQDAEPIATVGGRNGVASSGPVAQIP